MIPTPFGRLRGPARDPPDWCELRSVRAEPGHLARSCGHDTCPPARWCNRFESPRTKYLTLGTLGTFSHPSRRGASHPRIPRQLPVNAGGAAGSTASQQHIGRKTVEPVHGAVPPAAPVPVPATSAARPASEPHRRYASTASRREHGRDRWPVPARAAPGRRPRSGAGRVRHRRGAARRRARQPWRRVWHRPRNPGRSRCG
jgi:hypothetical protein